MKIRVVFCPHPWSYGYHAWLEGSEKVWGFGKTKEEALSDLIRSHPELQGVEVSL